MRVDRRWLRAAVFAAAMAPAGAVGRARGQEIPIPPPVIPPQAAPAPAFAPPEAVPGAMIPGHPAPPPPAMVAPPPPAMVAPPPPTMVAPGGPVHVHQPGPIGRALHHAGFFIHDRMVGEPERFDEPPLGWSIGQNFSAQAARASQHRYTLYRSDFFAGTERLTPDGIRRLGRMMSYLPRWGGPVLIEEDPNRPGLAESRRLAVMELVASNGNAIDPGRLIVGGSPYLGGRGDLSETYEGILLDRSFRAPATYPLNPIPNADFGAN
ncbi:hypothetical protein [Tautonia plasticadhaerens]|uniref:Uncharacterized protein n=1 Tax=Tautonia plasticadhaerens TaxID=2527974 RepID=A0A518H6W1_9BACT|nr:hypothetical protein [Tautonia plasticadhaerens]QDV36568.1 hypothetical protein ElP_44960 [Tautonia plasticadhaerens]